MADVAKFIQTINIQAFIFKFLKKDFFGDFFAIEVFLEPKYHIRFMFFKE